MTALLPLIQALQTTIHIWSENEVVSQVRFTRESLARETKNEVIYVHKSLFLPGQYKDIHTSTFWCLSYEKN